MAITKKDFIFNQKELSRAQVREKVVKCFLKEKPGPAKDETYNRYHYLVEKTKEGNVVIIRPANLKLGFDFRIDVEGMTFRKNTNAPSHIDLFEDLKKKYNVNKQFCDDVIRAIKDVNDMNDPEEVLSNVKDLKIGLSVELILKISKWFAIEQDIRYWNGWGRNKQILWLDLMRYYEFRYVPIKQGFKFYNKNGKLLTENMAAKHANLL